MPRLIRFVSLLALVAILPLAGVAATPTALTATEWPVVATGIAGESDQAVSVSQRHIAEKRYMLQLINEARVKAGVGTVTLGDNTAAQLHAESSLENCFSSHWGIDGLKPYMRYSLAGGYQSNSENGSGLDYCITAADGYAPNSSIQEEIRRAMAGWMNSAGHRRNLLAPHHRKVNIGLAWDRYNTAMVQDFEGDYIAYTRLPAITNGVLSFSGSTKNGAQLSDNLGQSIFYDPPPRELTRGQLARTYCYDHGRVVAALRAPPGIGYHYSTHEFSATYNPCPNPYDVPASAPAPRSAAEARQAWQEAYNASQSRVPQAITAPWVTASQWSSGGASFSIQADISAVLARHGHGVYSVVLWGEVDGTATVISHFSIFHGVTLSATPTPVNDTPTNVVATSEAAGTLTLSWEGGDGADFYLLIAVDMSNAVQGGPYQHKTAKVDDPTARAGDIGGLTSETRYLGIVVAVKVVGTELQTKHGTAEAVTVQ